nr:hypothetical protein [Herbaspirillum sp. ASV7]
MSDLPVGNQVIPQNVAQAMQFVANQATQRTTYFNGFGLGGGATDATITLHNGTQLVGTVQAPYPVLKELIIALTQLVESNEKALGITYQSLGEALQKLSGQNDEKQS